MKKFVLTLGQKIFEVLLKKLEKVGKKKMWIISLS
jgi:hypothetical protein